MKTFEVVIIGGSYAGLSAALALGRSLRNTLVIDAGLPCNRQTPHSQNFLTQDGSTPAMISTQAKKQVQQYETVQFYKGIAEKIAKTDFGFEVTTSHRSKFYAKRIVLATGVKDLLPKIKGFSECWGISIIHCPYCHGYEHSEQKTAIYGNSERVFHLAPMVKNLTNNLSILTSKVSDFDAAQQQKLNENNIQLVAKEITEIIHTDGQVKSIRFHDGSEEMFDVIYASIPFEQNTNIPQHLGCELDDMGLIKTDFMQQTNVPGVFACGDISSPLRSVAYAVATGNIAGAVANNQLCQENF